VNDQLVMLSDEFKNPTSLAGAANLKGVGYGSDKIREYRPLRECTSTGSVSYGIVQPGQHVENGVPIIRVNNINNGIVDITNPLKVHHQIDEKHRKTKLEGGEVLLSLVGTTGQCIVAGPELKGWNVARAIAVIKPAQDISAEWLSICLKSEEAQHFLDSRANTTVQKTLNLQDVREIPIMQVTEAEERYILEWWITLNDKIEINRRMNETLEAMAQALFKSWFVDFDPVLDNAILAGNPIPEEFAERAAMRKEILAQNQNDELGVMSDELAQHSALKTHHSEFPSGFTHTEELGWIPEGWSVKLAKDFCSKVQNGGTPKRSESDFWEGGMIPWLASGEVRQSIIVETGQYITERGLASSSAKWNPPWTTVIALYGATAGQTSLLSKELTTNQAVCALIPKKGCRFYNYLNFRNRTSELESKAVGSAQQNLSKGLVESVSQLEPGIRQLTAFDSLVGPMFEKRVSYLLQSQTLEKLRDTLLPILISGKLRVSEAKQLTEEALA